MNKTMWARLPDVAEFERYRNELDDAIGSADLTPAFRMFDRWRQENFFKYLREEYALDALVEYGTVPDEPTR